MFDDPDESTRIGPRPPIQKVDLREIASLQVPEEEAYLHEEVTMEVDRRHIMGVPANAAVRSSDIEIDFEEDFPTLEVESPVADDASMITEPIRSISDDHESVLPDALPPPAEDADERPRVRTPSGAVPRLERPEPPEERSIPRWSALKVQRVELVIGGKRSALPIWLILTAILTLMTLVGVVVWAISS